MKNHKIIFIAGSNGFVGKNLIKIFNKKKYNVLSPDRKILDLKDTKKLKIFLQTNNVTHIINCAGKVGGILENSLNQIDFFRENNELNYNLISCSLDLGIKNFLNLGTSCMYPDNYLSKMREKKLMTGKLEPTNLGYAMAKLSAANYIKLIRDKFGYNYSNVIPCNLYGPHDNFDDNKSHLVASIIKKISKAKKNKQNSVEIWGDGSPRREFLYVEDLTNFIYLSVSKDYRLPVFINIGYGKDYSVNQYYKKIMELFNYKVKLIYNLEKPNGIKRKLLDIALAKKLFKYSPKTNLDLGLRKTIKFYENTI